MTQGIWNKIWERIHKLGNANIINQKKSTMVPMKWGQYEMILLGWHSKLNKNVSEGF